MTSKEMLEMEVTTQTAAIAKIRERMDSADLTDSHRRALEIGLIRHAHRRFVAKLALENGGAN
jgi:CRISPR/Cas system-associated protein Csm6